MNKEVAQKVSIITAVYLVIICLIVYIASLILNKTFYESLYDYWIAILIMYGVAVYSGLKELKN